LEFLDKMNVAVDYIEAHLTQEIDYRQLAHRMGCSEYHFSRTFPFVAGMGLGLYVRRRRMTQAALDLQKPGAVLLDVAVAYGYSSVDGFARAFREVHGVPPSAVQRNGEAVRLFSKLTFTVRIQGGEAMVYRMVEKEAFRIAGIAKRVPLVFSGPNADIDALWKSVTPEQIARWKGLSNTEPRGIISASTNFSEDRMEGTGTLDHHIGAATTLVPGPEDQVLEVEAGSWAVFEARGNFPTNLQTTWGRIYSEWFPTAGCEARLGPEILWNEGPDTTKPDFKSEIWIPVQRSR